MQNKRNETWKYSYLDFYGSSKSYYDDYLVMSDLEFDLIKAQCLEIGSTTIETEYDGDKIINYNKAKIFAFRCTKTHENISSEVILSYYVRYDWQVWRTSDVFDVLKIVEAIRLNELAQEKRIKELKQKQKKMKVIKSKKAA